MLSIQNNKKITINRKNFILSIKLSQNEKNLNLRNGLFKYNIKYCISILAIN